MAKFYLILTDISNCIDQIGSITNVLKFVMELIITNHFYHAIVLLEYMFGLSQIIPWDMVCRGIQLA